MKNLLKILTLLFACFSFSQYEVLHINSSWNQKYDLDLSGLKHATVKYAFLEDQTPSFRQQIKSVPTILVFDKNGRTRGQWSGGIALKLKVTKEDIQDHINKLIELEKN
tara:strand:- start:76 stop:402 length:327 start_codon:yes stop_codon:yes gene_type:complete